MKDNYDNGLESKHKPHPGSMSVSELLKKNSDLARKDQKMDNQGSAIDTKKPLDSKDTLLDTKKTNKSKAQQAELTATPEGNNQKHNYLLWAIIVVASFVMRFIRSGISDNDTPIFDEKHYVTQAMEMLTNGGMENNPGYGLVVHPPMGKWLISAGEALFGYSPMGWRLTAIIAGVITVVLVSYMVKRLTNSTPLVVLSAVLMNIEGIGIGMSRFGMLDSFVALFATFIGFCAVMFALDEYGKKSWHESWWLFTAGVAGGLMMATKISGVYYMATFGVLLVLGVLVHSKNVRETAKALGMGLVFFFVMPVTIFFMSFIPWFSNENAVYRHAVEEGLDKVEIPSLLQGMPESIQNFYYYHRGVLNFHASLSSGKDSFHPYESKAWEWFLGSRPMLFYTKKPVDPLFTFGDASEGEGRIFLFTNPVVWLLAFVILAVSLVILFTPKRSIGWYVVFAGFLAGWIPWLLFPQRQMYLFYIAPLAPFVVLGIMLLIKEIAHSRATKKIGVWVEGEDNTDTFDNLRSGYGDNQYALAEIEKHYTLSNEDTDGDKKHKIIYHDDDVEDKAVRRIAVVYGAIAIAAFVVFIPWLYGIPMEEDWHDMLLEIPLWEPVTSDNIVKVTSFLS